MNSLEFPQSTDPLQRALGLAKEGKVKAATELLEKALNQEPRPKNALSCARNLGFFLLQNGKELSFLKWLNNPGRVWREDPFLLLLQGKALFRLEDLKGAERAYQKVLRASDSLSSWKAQAKADLKSLEIASRQVQKAQDSLGRARFLIFGGVLTLLLGLGFLMIILRRMEIEGSKPAKSP